MRADSLGMFWQDEPPVKKEPVEKIKRTPPEPTWLLPNYLPGLEQALNLQLDLYTNEELIEARNKKERLIFDIEVYPNYFLIGFKGIDSGKVIYFEMTPERPLDCMKVRWILESFCVVSFNGINFDLPITSLAVAGKSNAVLKESTEQIIVFNQRPGDILRKHKVKKLICNHIDLIEIAPLQASLKIYGGRLHVPAMQDLPFHPNTVLSENQIAIVRSYCLTKDLVSTQYLYKDRLDQITLREELTNEYGIDVRSKSDAQIAESVISEEITRLSGGMRPTKPNIEAGTAYRYEVPSFISYRTEAMQWTLNVIRNAWFIVDESGAVGMPPEIKELKIPIGSSFYQMGIGGLHSCEKNTAHFADDHTLLIDRDVTSYYPFIILLLGLFPPHLGQVFLTVYRNIVNRRIDAKKRGLKKIADSLKITINGSFGKLLSKYSHLYAPHLGIQVTVTGQLSLLMLIERLELAGIPVVSANTDGVVIKCPKHKKDIMDTVVAAWERDTGFETEDTSYIALFSRDVNSYVAVKDKNRDGKYELKMKGAYAPADLSRNPKGEICIDAIEALLTKGIPIEQTITTCRDIRRFVHVRNVTGGAVKVWGGETPNEYLGKAVRWYYATDQTGELVYAKNGNKVPRSDGAFPCMELPTTFPENVDYQRYITETIEMLQDMGFSSLNA